MGFRIGFGYDVHKLVEGRKLVICGIEIPHEKGLEGHSDADVAIHALIDAILGAAAMGDIGTLFPDTDQTFKDIDSKLLLKETMKRIKAEGFKIGNADITIVAQEPKVKPFIPDMRGKIAETMECGIHKVSVKATTTEHLGFTGRKEGIAAYSVALLEKVENQDP